MLSNLLIYRVLIFNMIVLAMLIWASTFGLVQRLFEGETTGIGYLMVAVFVMGMVGFLQRVWKTSTALNLVKAGTWVDARKYGIKGAYIGDVAVWLVTLGLMGNILGFSHAAESLNLSGGTDAALKSLDGLLAGMKIAFYTTLIGTGLGLWLAVNFRMLKTAVLLLRIDADDLKVRQEADEQQRWINENLLQPHHEVVNG